GGGGLRPPRRARAAVGLPLRRWRRPPPAAGALRHLHQPPARSGRAAGQRRLLCLEPPGAGNAAGRSGRLTPPRRRPAPVDSPALLGYTDFNLFSNRTGGLLCPRPISSPARPRRWGWP